jgi:hypothetical protein
MPIGFFRSIFITKKIRRKLLGALNTDPHDIAIERPAMTCLKRYLFITTLLFSSMRIQAAAGDTLRYQTIMGKDTTSTIFTLSQLDRDKKAVAEYNRKGIQCFSGVIMTDSSATRKWTYKSDGDKIDLAASSANDTIILKGLYKSKKIDKKYPLNAVVWKQMFPFDLKDFIVSDNATTSFCGISTIEIGSLQLGTLEVKKIGIERLEINGKDTELLHVKVTLPGFMSMFWHGDYWYKKDTGLFVKSVSYDSPGAPPVISILAE